ncbi:MAG: PKD domain-containing protein, partial [Candidatus Lutacidiplasmatales archaeon]
GLVQLLGSNYTSPTAVSLTSGAFELTGLPTGGQSFGGWTVTGGCAVGNAASASTTLVVTGAGTVVAQFTATPTLTNVTFDSTGASGSIVLGSVATLGPSGPLATEGNLTSVLLASGSYPIQSAPPPGWAFASWSATGPAYVVESSAAASWLVVSSAGGVATVTAELTPDGTNVTVVAQVVGAGTVSIGGTAIPYNATSRTSIGAVNLSAGTISLVANASPGWRFLSWSVLPGGVSLPGNSTEANVTLANGTAYVFGEFAALVTVLSQPSAGGQVVFDGGPPQSNGSSVPLTPGLHALGAAPFGGYAFQRWTVSNSSALWVSKPLQALTHVTVNTTGTLTAVFASTTNETLTLQAAPAAGGFIQFNFDNLSANPTINTSVAASTFQLHAVANYGYRFLGWNVTGPASVLPGELTVTGTGAVVTARFGARFFPVTFVVTRPGTVALTVNGVAEPSGVTLGLARGVYPLSATVTAPNTTFLGWSTSLVIGNVSPSHTSATVTVDGSGTVFGIVAGFVLSGFVVSPLTTDVGALVHINVTANGTGPLSYKYLGLPVNCNSVNRANASCRPGASGTYPIHAAVTDSGGAVEMTPTLLLNVVGDPLVAAFSATPAVVDLGIHVAFSVTVQQGLGPYTFLYTSLPPGCATTNGPTLSCSPGMVGPFLVKVTVTDSVGLVTSSTTSLTVEANPKVTGVSVSRSTLDVGATTYLNASSTGGTGPFSFTYAGLPAGCAATTGPNLTCNPTVAGTANVTATVHDTFGRISTSSVVTLTVHPRPSVAAFTASPSTIRLGQITVFLVTTAGGTGAPDFAYASLPPGCPPGIGLQTFSCTPSATGTYSVTVTIVDADSEKANGTTTLTVVPVAAGNPSPNGPSPGSDIQWKYVALIGAIALVIA